ncbi:MAG: 3'(2'),5'-bisphosphate nucleotidase CysQ [Saonia sp.]
MNNYLSISIESAIEAGKEILKIYENDFKIYEKDDQSPLTEADMASNKIINDYLEATNIPIISEENKTLDFEVRKNWDTCWMVDPLDGTKEFIKKNGEFTVNIAMIQNNIPILGVIYVPVTRELYYADVQEGKAYKTVLNDEHVSNRPFFDDKDLIAPSIGTESTIGVVGSRSHMNEQTLTFIDDLKKRYTEIDIVSKGSSLKFCLVAEGRADVYPRFAPTMEWDTAAGHAICTSVGLKVTSQETKRELEYNKENLLNPHFLVSN